MPYGERNSRFVEHHAQHALETRGVHDRKQPASAVSRRPHAGDVRREVGPVLDEPVEPLREPWQLREHLGLERLHREERDQPHHRAHLQGMSRAVGQVQHVVEEPVLSFHSSIAVAAQIRHRVGDVDEVLPELARDVLVRRILGGQLHGNREQVEAVHRHPARAVRLLEVPAGRQRPRSVEHADVVEAQEARPRTRCCLRRPCGSPTR